MQNLKNIKLGNELTKHYKLFLEFYFILLTFLLPFVLNFI